MMMRINLTKMVLVQKIPTQKTTDLTMRKIRIQKMRMMPLKTLRTRTRKKILLIMKIQKIRVPIMRTRGEEASDNGDSSEDAGDTADDTDNSSSSDTVASISIHSRIS